MKDFFSFGRMKNNVKVSETVSAELVVSAVCRYVYHLLWAPAQPATRTLCCAATATNTWRPVLPLAVTEQLRQYGAGGVRVGGWMSGTDRLTL